MKTILSFLASALLAISAFAQSSTLTINTTTGLINVPPGMVPVANFATLKVGGVSITPVAYGSGVATWLATPSSANLAAAVTGETGSGALVFATSPTFVTPLLGTPTSGTLTNCTGLPVASGIDGLGTGVATFLGTPSSANLATAVTGETGSGALVFATSPDFTTGITVGGVAVPTISSSSALTNKTYNGLTVSTSTGTLTIANGKTLTASNTITVAGTDGSSLNIGAGGTLGTAAYTAATAYAPAQVAVASVNTQAAKLALTGKNIGDLVEVTYTSTGKSLWRYEGGGESTATNWKLIGTLRCGQMEGDQAFSGTTFADVTAGAIDYLPAGKYVMRLRMRIFAGTSGGMKWRLTATGSGAFDPNSRAYQFTNASAFITGDITNMMDSSGFASYDGWGGTNEFSLEAPINCNTAGGIKLEAAQKNNDGSTFLHTLSIEFIPQ